MHLLNNLKNYLNLSITSLVLSIFLLNFLNLFISLELSLKFILVILFLFNFFRIKSSFSFKNTYKFFILFFLLALVSRLIEYHLFIFFYSVLSEKNVSWLITLSISFIFKFIYINVLNYLKI